MNHRTLTASAWMTVVWFGAAAAGQPCSPGVWEACPAGTGFPSPAARAKHVMAYDSARATLVLFGGTDGAVKGDTWEYRFDRWMPAATTGPSARMSSAMVFDAARGKTVLFGGNSPVGGGAYLADQWEWDGIEWTRRTLGGSAPSGRYGHAMTYDSFRSRVILFGGFDGARKSDTWEWDGATWSLRSTTGPSGRHMHAMTYDAARNRTVLFGGFDGSLRGDTWEWDGAAWTLRSAGGAGLPSARSGAVMYHDAARSRVVLFGGHDGVYRGDTWEWNGTTWSLRAAAPSPTARTMATAAWDSTRQKGSVFGGILSGSVTDLVYAGDLWENGDPTPRIAGHPADATVTAGQTATFSVNVSGSGPITYQWRRNGQPLVDSLRFAGSGSPMLTIAPTALTDDGSAYDVLVSNACGSAVSVPATLSVRCRADTDGNRRIEPIDVSVFISQWMDGLAQGTDHGDYDRNGVVETPDIGGYVNAWLAALNGSCPP